jgi:HlyD family secretion protein
MKRFLFWSTLAAVLGLGVFGYLRLHAAWRGSVSAAFRTAPISRGTVQLTVNSTGTVQPVQSVQVGTFASGPIQKVYVDFNSHVKAGEILAEVDPRTYKANVAREEAALAYKKADVQRVTALLEQATREEKRALRLREAKKTFISESEVDKCTAERKSLEAQLQLALAGVQESEASLASARTNLEFTIIKSPVDGLVIDRKVDSGQTVAAQFQTPVMFVVAPNLEEKVYIYASVDEADIGLIRDAHQRKQPVKFTVDAYPDDTFQGKIYQIRLNPTTVQNVVTYTVVVESPNHELKLLPGMTANLAFQIEQHRDVLRIPNGALRFHPKAEQVRVQDRKLVEGLGEDGQAQSDEAEDKNPASRHELRKHIWVIDGDFLAATKVVIGLSDTSHTEILSGSLREGQPVVVGIRTESSQKSSSSPPP